MSAGRGKRRSARGQQDGAGGLVYYVFDLLVVAGKDVMGEPLTVRRELLRSPLLRKLDEPIREFPQLDATLPPLIHSVLFYYYKWKV